MTSTTDATLDVARGTLTLVTVSEDYGDWPGATPEDRTFYATVSEFSEEEYVTLVVSESDDRHRGMWELHGHGLELEGPHYGWNVPRNRVRPADAATPADDSRPFTVGDLTLLPDRPRPASADMTSDQREALPISEAYPVGSMWLHRSYSTPATVRGYARSDRYVIVDHDGETGREWIRGALDTYGTFAGWVDDTTGEDTTTTPETFTREDVDRLVRQAREEADQAAREALEEFKRAANERAVEYAESNGLCSEFERCMEDIGLLGRDEWHERNDETYRVTFTVTVDVTARDESDAEYKARAELYEDLSYPLDQTIRHHDTEAL